MIEFEFESSHDRCHAFDRSTCTLNKVQNLGQGKEEDTWNEVGKHLSMGARRKSGVDGRGR